MNQQRPDAKKRVLIIEHDADLARMIASILNLEGYEAEWVLRSDQTLAEVRQRQPDLLIVDIPGNRPEDGQQLLDDLRMDDVASRTPVLALTTAEALAEAAKASYNIRASLTKPFDLDDLLAGARRTLSLPPLHAAVPPEAQPPGTLAQGVQILARHSREAIFAWIQRLRQEAPWRDRDDLRLSDLLDNVPVLVEALSATLRYGKPDEFFAHNPQIVERVREHTHTRRQQDISLAAVIREYTLLRKELWTMFRRHLPQDTPMNAILDLQETFNYTLDRIVEATIPAYLESPAKAA